MSIRLRYDDVSTLDRIVVLEDASPAKLGQARNAYETLWDRQAGAFLEVE